MTLSYRSILTAFSLFLCIIAALLCYQSFFPNKLKTELNHKQYQQDLHLFLEETKRHSAFATIAPKQLAKITHSANRLILNSQGFNSSALLQRQLQQLLSQLDDPAAFARLPESTQLERLPVELIYDGQRWQVFTPNGALLNPDFPYLSHIDGLPISRWCQASQRYLNHSLKQSTAAQAVWLTRTGQLRSEIGLKTSNQALLTLTDGETHLQQPLSLVRDSQMQAFAATTKQAAFPLPPKVDSNTLQMLTQQLIRKTKEDAPAAFIIDIRAIKQPQEQLLAWLERYFSDNKGSQTTLALLQYKRFASARADRIASQYIPMTQLSFFEQTELNDLGFDNELNQGSVLSDYLVRQYRAFDTDSISEMKSSTEAHMTKPIQLLLRVDASCRQECEWIALASQNWPRVSLIGAATRGDLSPHHRVTLPNSGIQIQLSSGLVYHPNGQRLSAVGIAPKIPVNQLAFKQADTMELISNKLLAQSPLNSDSPPPISLKSH